jgi:hypothetical protein
VLHVRIVRCSLHKRLRLIKALQRNPPKQSATPVCRVGPA